MTIGTVERAFAIAREGTCRNVDDIRRVLKQECFENVDSHLSGNIIKRQLVAAIAARGS
jgi:hypothetical protein